MKNTFYRNYGKRLFDIMLVIPGILLLSPFLLIISIFVYIKLGFPILFKQTRPGMNGLPFTIYKFRTMLDLRDERGNLLPNEQRLTRFGMFLRSTSLDELPELLNVLKGDMSLVGPRPLLMEYLQRYSTEQARRHTLKPGITGLAQVKGRNAITWEDKFRYDIWYVDNCSLLIDMKIMLQTFFKILKREGIHPHDTLIMPEFKGTDEPNQNRL